MLKKENPVFKRSDESYEKNRIFMQQYNKTEKAKEMKARYAAKTTQVKITLNPDRDADILEALDQSKPLAPQIADLVRLALKARSMFQ